MQVLLLTDLVTLGKLLYFFAPLFPCCKMEVTIHRYIHFLSMHNKLPQTWQFLQIQMYYLTVSVGQKAHFSAYMYYAQSFTRLKSRCQWGTSMSGVLTRESSASKVLWSFPCDDMTEVSTLLLTVNQGAILGIQRLPALPCYVALSTTWQLARSRSAAESLLLGWTQSLLTAHWIKPSPTWIITLLINSEPANQGPEYHLQNSLTF